MSCAAIALGGAMLGGLVGFLAAVIAAASRRADEDERARRIGCLEYDVFFQPPRKRENNNDNHRHR